MLARSSLLGFWADHDGEQVQRAVMGAVAWWLWLCEVHAVQPTSLAWRVSQERGRVAEY